MESKKNVLKKRDLSWLKFNERVLQEAQNPDVPLYERIKFLAIFSSNLDEFFSVRVSALRQFKRIRKADRKEYNIKPNKQLKAIYAEVNRQQEIFGSIINNDIIPDLKKIGMHLMRKRNYSEGTRTSAIKKFNDDVRKDIVVHWIEQEDNAPFLIHNKLYLIFRTKTDRIGLVNVPVKEHGRFVHLSNENEMHSIAFLEDVISIGLLNAIDSDVEEIISIKLSRDAETYIEDEFTGDLIEKIKQAISDRGDGLPTRLLYDSDISDEFLRRIRKIFTLSKSDMIEGGRYHNFVDFFSFPKPEDIPGIEYPEMAPVAHKELQETESILKHIQSKDEILHFPYQSFKSIPRLLRESAESDDVRHIKMTLYRISKTSEIAKSLLYAMEKGKKVTVFIEVKARFDEQNNLEWGNKLKANGANVIYSYPGIKIHSKIILLRMKEESELRDVCYIGTGNFNEKTATIYCDHGLLTSHKKITNELNQVFQILTGTMIVPKTKHLLISPYTTRTAFLELVNYEIEEAKQGREAWMVIKMNSLEDSRMINKLYEASRAGVQIEMIVRGFCCLVPGIEGMSENISIISIVDRFLEHARIYHFHHGGKDKMYIGSADWMTRNLDRRIEVCTPIYDEDIKSELKHMLDIQLADNVKARLFDEAESNNIIESDGKEVRAQFETYKYLKDKAE